MAKKVKVKDPDPKLKKEHIDKIEEHLTAVREILEKVNVDKVALDPNDDIFKL